MAKPEFDDVVERHLADMRNSRKYRPGTVYARKRALIRMAAVIGKPLPEASPADLQKWASELRVVDNTLVHYASHARSFYSWMVRKRYMDRNPMDDVEVPVLMRGHPRPIADEDLMRAIVTVAQPVRLWLVLACHCGLRCKEIALLRRENVLDTADPPVLIVAPEATKGRRGRVVPMSSFVVAELREFGLPRAGWMFKRADRRPGPNSPAVVSHVTARALHDIGIDATAHQCRHWYGTKMYRQTKDQRLVQELMGHADPATTAIYVEISRTDAVAAVEALPVPPMLKAVGQLCRSTLNRKGGLTCDYRRFTRNRAQLGRPEAVRVRVRETAGPPGTAVPARVRGRLHAGLAGRAGRLGHDPAAGHRGRVGGDRDRPRGAPGPRQSPARDHPGRMGRDPESARPGGSQRRAGPEDRPAPTIRMKQFRKEKEDV